MSKISFEEMFETIDRVLQNEPYGIGIHGVASGKNRKTREEMLENMLQSGVSINEGSSVLATISSLGTVTQLENNHKKTISTYSFGREAGRYNLLIAVPAQIKVAEEGVYLGFPDPNTDTAGNQYKTTCVLDYLCCGDEKKGTIPKEFILGYYIEEGTRESGQITFVRNEKHYSNLSEQEKKDLLYSLQQKLVGKYKTISDAVMNNDIGTLEKLQHEEIEQNRERYLKKRRELLEVGIVNEEMAKAFAERKESSAASQAKNYISNQQLETRNIATVGTRRKIPLGLLTNNNCDNAFIQQCRKSTCSEDEIAEYDSNSMSDESENIKAKTYSKDNLTI